MSHDDGDWNKVGEPPGIYPAELWDWYECYFPNPPGKLAHDAMLYLAESGVRHFATVAYSIACEDGALTHEQHLAGLLGKNLSFGAWVDVLRACAPAVHGWDFSQLARGPLPACGRLTTVSNVLDELYDVDSMKPVSEAIERAPKKIGWWTAWKVLVEYRNRTLGHPDARLLKTAGFHEVLTEVVAAAVAELLWNDVVADAASQHRQAWFSSRTTGARYEVELRAANRMRHKLTLTGEEGGRFVLGDELILSRVGEGWTYRGKRQDPRDADLVTALRPGDTVQEQSWARELEDTVAWETVSSLGFRTEEVVDPMSLGLGSVAITTGAEAFTALDSWGLPFVDMTEVSPAKFIVLGDDGESHEVAHSTGFFVGRFPVTQLLYEHVMHENPSRFPAESHPVEFVSWVAAVSFCNELSALSDLEPAYENVTERGWRVDASKPGFRLLMEDEWALCSSVGYKARQTGTPLEGPASSATTSPVDTGEPNPIGLHGMLGNVWEWCNDIYRTGYSPGTMARVIEPDAVSPRVIRGGSFVERPGIISATSRFKHPARSGQKNIGLRIGRSSPESNGDVSTTFSPR